MDKQKQIEEMERDIVRSAGLDVHGKAKYLYDLGYRKIPENAVVLTREELEEKIDCCDVSMIHHDDDGKRYIKYEKYEDFTDRLGKRIQQLKGQLKQARKETAEKFAEKVSQVIVDNTYPYFDKDGKPVNIFKAVVGFEKIDEIAKDGGWLGECPKNSF